jgi:hypothetical protein
LPLRASRSSRIGSAPGAGTAIVGSGLGTFGRGFCFSGASVAALTVAPFFASFAARPFAGPALAPPFGPLSDAPFVAAFVRDYAGAFVVAIGYSVFTAWPPNSFRSAARTFAP